VSDQPTGTRDTGAGARLADEDVESVSGGAIGRTADGIVDGGCTGPFIPTIPDILVG